MSCVAVPSEMKASPGLIGAEADRADSGVAAARGDDRLARQPERVGDLGLERRDRVGPLDQRRQNRRGDAGRHERLGAPAPLRLVEPPRARRVAHVGELFAGQRQTQIVLGQQHAGDARVDFGFVAAKPHQLRRGEARHRLHAGDGGEAGAPLAEFARLGEGAPVVVQDRRPQRPVVGAERHRPVHLSGKADRGDRAEQSSALRA